MSPKNIIRYLIGGRNPVDIGRTDPFGRIILGGGHPSPQQTREYRGEVTVFPFYLSDALYYTHSGRRINQPQIMHFADTQERPRYRELGFSNDTLDQIAQIYYHDLSEDLSLGTFGGNYAVLRFIAQQSF